MMTARNETLGRVIRAGIELGLLPEGAVPPAPEARPWPVTLLTALGAWLAAIPLLGVVGILLGPLMRHGGGAFVVGALVLAASIVVLRSRDLPVFVEQLAVPGLLVGMGAIGFSLHGNAPDQAASALLGLIAIGIAALVDRPWLRVLLGAAAALACVTTLAPWRLFDSHTGWTITFWISLHAALAVWLAAVWSQRQLTSPRAAMLVESTSAGWLLLTLAGLAWWSGMTFLVGGAFGGGAGALANELAPKASPGEGLSVIAACSAALACGGMLVGARRWPALRQPATAAVGSVLAVLAWFMPALGGALLALAWTATTSRWRLAAAAAAAAAWILGGFYYQLAWPLAQKAVVLVVAGGVLGAIAWLSRSTAATPAERGHSTSPDRRGALLMIGGAVLVLAACNFSIWEKEKLIADGERVFVELAPIDPRSLMQGDFMRLNYNVPGLREEDRGQGMALPRMQVAARREAKGVLTLLRTEPAGAPLAPGELRIELTPQGGRWMLVSDAWFFREGDGERWRAAKYGEFRVTPDGKALLVGLADAQLKAIAAQP